MRRLFIALAALFLLRADMYPDASNAVHPQARTNILGGGFGFVGDGATAAITTTAGSATFSPALPASAIGKAIIVPGAGASGDPLTTTVATTTTFAAPAATATSPTTWYADKGRNCPVQTSQAGAGNYAPGEVITLSGGVACKVIYTQVAATPTIVSGGAGCANGTGITFAGTTGTYNYSPFYLFGTVSGGTLTAITGMWWSGVYAANPANPANEPVVGSGCTGASVSFKMGVRYAQVIQAGNIAALPADPVAQVSTSGSGTGATFNMAGMWQPAGIAHYGTDNTAAMTALAAATNGPAVTFPAGTYLFQCGSYSMASATSLVGDGIGRSILKLFPYCSRSAPILGWASKAGVSVSGLTIDNSRAFNPTPPAFQYVVAADDAKNFRFNNNAIIGMGPYNVGLIMNSYADTPMSNPIIRDNYFQLQNTDGTPANAVVISNSGGINAGIMGGVMSGNYSEGGGLVACFDGGVITGNQITGHGYGTGIYSPLYGQGARCKNSIISNNVVHDSVQVVDIDLTAVSGFEINGDNMQISNNLAYRNAGHGFRLLAKNALVTGNTAWSNMAAAQPGAAFADQQSGFQVNSGNGGEGGHGSVLLSNNAYDAGEGTQLYGYSESGAYPLTVTLANNNFTGPNGAYGLRIYQSESPGHLVANLPPCILANRYQTRPVYDQLSVPTYRGALTGGGNITVLAFCNGTGWEAH